MRFASKHFHARLGLLISLFVIFSPAVASVQTTTAGTDFTGRWLYHTAIGPGVTRDTIYFLKQSGDLLSGSILTGYRSQDISEGAVRGNQASWVVITGTGNQQRRVEYRAVLNGDEIAVTSAGVGVSAKKVSSDGTPISPFADLPKVVPPALHDVSDGGLARTPPMGWNSWNKFRANVDDKSVREIADAMVSSGMKDVGYQYVNIDDTWEGYRDSAGNIVPNSKFPDMKVLADYVHSKGLKLGIYSSPGPKTCAGYEGSYGHEQQDAKTWANWGIDYLKYDWCSASVIFKPEEMRAVYQIMGDALRAATRPIVYSLCQYGQQAVQTWGTQVGGNLWRTTGDIGDNWRSMSGIGFDRQIGLEKYAGPGHWNDPDMLEIGNGGMSDTEYQTHMALWAILGAPLLAGNDLRSMTPAIRDILTNRDVIAVDQDPAGKQGYRLSKDEDKEVWVRPLSGGDWAIGLFNRGNTEAAPVSIAWNSLNLSGSFHVRDLWQHKELALTKDEFSAQVPVHGVVLIRIAR
jgi:alpha-galactosidase